MAIIPPVAVSRLESVERSPLTGIAEAVSSECAYIERFPTEWSTPDPAAGLSA